jgi:two-component sensor histidine kinase
MAILKSNQIEEGLLSITVSLAEAYETTNNVDSSMNYYNRSIVLAEKQGNTNAVVDGLEGLLRIYSSQSNNEWFRNTLKKYNLYNDSLKSQVSMQASKDEILVSRFIEIFTEAEIARTKNQKLENDNRELLSTTLFLVIVIIMLMLLIIIRKKNRKKIETKKREVEKNNIELEKSYQLISESNNKNELLLKELHHRVKNNLQIISSLFSLQLNAKNLDVNSIEVFQDAKNRIHSISLVHKKLYQSNNFEQLEFKSYLSALADDIIASQVNQITIQNNADCPPITIETAISLGLIFNELLTNSLKHSKNTDQLVVSIQFEKNENTERFIYSDNGIGVTNVELMKENEGSIGVTLIHLLAEQLDATIEYKESSVENEGFWISLSGKFS